MGPGGQRQRSTSWSTFSNCAFRAGWPSATDGSNRSPPTGSDRWSSSAPYEHHSNELPWRESIADLVVIDEDADGHIDLEQLEQRLIHFADRPLRIGSFSAASNVTGVLSDTDRIATLLHKHGALSFWDYAAAGPYVPIRMRDSAFGRGDHKDAIFLSPHKFVGGPQTPGGSWWSAVSWCAMPYPPRREAERSRSWMRPSIATLMTRSPARKGGHPSHHRVDSRGGAGFRAQRCRGH